MDSLARKERGALVLGMAEDDFQALGGLQKATRLKASLKDVVYPNLLVTVWRVHNVYYTSRGYTGVCFFPASWMGPVSLEEPGLHFWHSYISENSNNL